jgi:hypothetical protein
MARTKPNGALRRLTDVVIVLLTGLIAATGCTQPGDTRKSEAQTAPSPTTTAMRLDKPKRLLDRWSESVDRSLRETAQQDLGVLSMDVGDVAGILK